MSGQTVTGTSTTDPTTSPAITVPLGGDGLIANDVKVGAWQPLANFISWIRTRMARLDVLSAFTAGATSTGPGSSGAGFAGTGGSPNGPGVSGTGTGSGSGVAGTGGTSSGTGVSGTGGSSNGSGLSGQGTGSGSGAALTGGSTGAGLSATGGASGAQGGKLTAGGSTKGALNLAPVSSDPSSPDNGDVWVHTDGTLRHRGNGSTFQHRFPVIAWGKYSSDGFGGLTVIASGNITSMTIDGSGDLSVVLTSAAPSANFAVALSYHGNDPGMVMPQAKTHEVTVADASNFKIGHSSQSARLSLSSSAIRASFMVVGG